MLDGDVSGSFQGVLDQLKRFDPIDLSPLAENVAGLVVEGNRLGLLAGLDADGDPFIPIKESTRKHRSGDGPPGIPDGVGSPLIASFAARIEPGDAGQGLRVVAGWESGDPAIPFFNSGSAHQAPRNIVGIRPETRVKIQATVDQFAAELAQSLTDGDIDHAGIQR